MLRCARCAATWHDDHDRRWGRTQESDGYGSERRCTALVPDETAPRLADGTLPLQVCGGPLRFEAEPADDQELQRIRKVTDIQPGARR